MAWKTRGERKGKRKIPEPIRQQVIKRDTARGCWFKFGGICTELTGAVQVHHVIDAEDGGSDDPSNLVLACKSCHVHQSAIDSQRRSVEKANEWKRRPEKHPGVLD